MTTEYWVWLQLVLGYACDTVHKVVTEYGDARSFYYADDEEKIKRCQLSKKQADRLHKISRRTVYRILKDCNENGIRIITPLSEEYPERLWAIADPPCVLYVKGQKLKLNKVPTIAVVGPRKVSVYGSKCANVISNTLASCGFVIVSGGALGGDSAAHLGALDSGGKTVAVLGGGILSGYLKANSDIRERISENGCLISEQPPFELVSKGIFSIRNRIISGISDGVIIVEASAKSGTLITARHANEQSRDVFVIPGSPSLQQYEGSNRLLSDGAKMLLGINDVIDEYLYIYPKLIKRPSTKVALPEVDNNYSQIEYNEPKAETLKIADAPVLDELPDLSCLSDEAKELYIKLRSFSKDVVLTVDTLLESDGRETGSALATVTELEMLGFVEAMPGGRYTVKKL